MAIFDVVENWKLTPVARDTFSFTEAYIGRDSMDRFQATEPNLQRYILASKACYIFSQEVWHWKIGCVWKVRTIGDIPSLTGRVFKQKFNSVSRNI